MDVCPRNLIVGALAALGLFSTAGLARAISADVLTVTAGASYTGPPVQLTLTADDKAAGLVKSLTLDLSSPIPAVPSGVSLLLSADPIPQDGVHTIEIIAATGAPFVPGVTTTTVTVDFSWTPESPQLFSELCVTGIGFGPPCRIQTTDPEDLTEILFGSAFPNGAPFHVVLETVPEPNSLSLMTGGIAGLILLMRRRRPPVP